MQVEHWQTLILAALSGGLIGWVTNWLAIKALFHPRQPIKIIFFTFQGLLPKRQKDLARNLGRIIEDEFLSVEQLIKQVKPDDIAPVVDELMKENRQEMQNKIREYINKLSSKIPFIQFSAESLVSSIMDKLEVEIGTALKKQLPKMLDHAAEKAAQKISVSDIVNEKVSQMDLDKLENLFYKISGTEMALIIRLGGVIGIFVGCLQWVIHHFVIA